MTARRLVPAFLFAVALGGCRGEALDRVPPDRAHKLLLDRNWIDQMPENERDKLHVYRFVPSMGGGVFQDRTIFAGHFELFQFEHTGDAIRFNLLHTHDRKTSPYRIDVVPPRERKAGLDLRLTIAEDPRGPRVYYGSSRETHDLDADLRALLQP